MIFEWAVRFFIFTAFSGAFSKKAYPLAVRVEKRTNKINDNG
jgi:hypothetical protein